MIARADFDTPGDALPRPHPNCYWLLPGRILAGEHPARTGSDGLPARLLALHKAGITHFIDLTSAHDRQPVYVPLAAVRLSHPIADFGLPSIAGMQATLRDAADALRQDGVIYLHCKAGVGRTGTVAACLLVEHGYSPQDALALLQRKWQVAGQCAHSAHTPETDAQRGFVAAWLARPREPGSA